MFAKACELANHFTRPIIVSMRFYDKSIECGAAAFVVLNDEGWIITAAHIWGPILAFQKHAAEMKQYEEQIKKAEQDRTLTAKQRKKQLKQIKPNLRWIINTSIWCSWDSVAIKDIKALPEGDILIGRLEPYEQSWVKQYPIIKDPNKSLQPGTSLCKLGYPFHKLNATFDENTNTFVMAPGAVPLPRFPIDGIYTRNVVFGKSKDGKYDIKYLETSSPGLKGQSGGPIFDINGTVWAIQSRTTSYPLGFNPKVKKDGKEVEENQFLNVGLGIHPEIIVAFLTDNGIKFQLSDY
ncbi:MAG: trypsin-like peptidase domain-containing protein [Dehalococcoidales bacterium]|nr:trypsin-like peptidase domain-containing protein [Dehalococcoidales bacterium]